MSDEYMNVGTIIDALSRFDRSRMVIGGGRPIKAIVSIEPGGAVVIHSDADRIVDPVTCEVTKQKSLWGGFYAADDGDAGDED